MKHIIINYMLSKDIYKKYFKTFNLLNTYMYFSNQVINQ